MRASLLFAATCCAAALHAVPVALAAGTSEGTTFPVAKGTELFRAQIVKAAGN